MDAMLLLEGDAMLRVYEDFKKVEDEEERGLTLDEFITTVFRNVDTTLHDKRALIIMLIDLFR